MELSYKSALLVAATFAIMAAGCKPDAPSDQAGRNPDQATAQQAANELKKNEEKAIAIDDSVITAKVKSAIVAESELSALEIQIDTANGVVTLTGAVDTPQNMERAAQMAKAVEGVKTVNNQLSVKALG